MWYLQLADFGIELRFEEVVVRVRLAEWVMVKESLRSRTLMRVSVGIKKKKKNQLCQMTCVEGLIAALTL